MFLSVSLFPFLFFVFQLLVLTRLSDFY